LGLGLAGCLLGLAIAQVISVVGTSHAAPLLPLDLQSGLTWRAACEGVGVALVMTLMFSLPPLLEIRHVKPNSLLRREPVRRGFDWMQLAARVVLAATDLSLALTILGGFVTACGLLILIGSITVTKFQRVYEAAILKTIGAKKKVLIRIALTEYAVLGLLAGSIGSVASVAMSWAMTFGGRTRVPWQMHPELNVAGVALTVLLVALVGLAASWGVITGKPLGTSREE
jgi:predicted lysophospholipase L1 biosynthesis ABC-type transport system permease subunit